jgi:hypothetical protein
LGTVLKTVYPLHKRKIVAAQEDDTSLQEVEKILNNKYNKNTKSYEYFVKWKKFEADENSWEPESSFDTLDIINKYYDWLKPHTGVVNNCKIFKRVIVAADTSSTLFGVTGCTAPQGHCSLLESIVTWIPTDIIDECPYESL